jgi:AmiR/NasT family two-component response regulator
VGKEAGSVDSAARQVGLRVLAADEDQAALDTTADLLRELGHEVTACAVSLREAAEMIASEDPDLAVVVVHEDDAHALDLIEEIREYSSGPVIALLAGEDPEFVRAAAERGIFAYARPVTPETVQGAIEVAVRRHAETARLNEQVDQLEHAMERRGAIERAKGIVMERHGVDDREAFELLRSHARARSRSVVEVARSVTEGHALLPRNGD